MSGKSTLKFYICTKTRLDNWKSKKEFFLRLHFQKLRNKKIAHLIRFLWLVVKNEVDTKQPFTTIISFYLVVVSWGNDCWGSRRRCCEMRTESTPLDLGIKYMLRIFIETNWGFWVRVSELSLKMVVVNRTEW